MAERAFTGRRRIKRTHWSVRVADVVSRAVITIGGIGTITSVVAVFLFLVWVVWPLFLGARIDSRASATVPEAPAAPLHVAVEEYGRLAWVLGPDGTLLVFRTDTGDVVERRPLFADQTLTAACFGLGDDSATLAFADGSVAFGSVGFATGFLDQAEVAEESRALPVGAFRQDGAAIVERVSDSQFRRRSARLEFEAPVSLVPGSAIRLVDQVVSASERITAVLADSGELLVFSLRQRRNLMTGKTTYATKKSVLPYQPPAGPPPRFLLLSGLGDSLVIAWADGRAQRYNTRDFAAPRLQEELDLVPEPAVELTALQALLGRTTLLAGDSTGRVQAWFPALREDSDEEAGLVRAHTYPGHGEPVVALATSARMRVMVTSYGDGSAELRHVTSHKRLGSVACPHPGAPLTAALFPKDDGLLAYAGGEIATWGLDPMHPEATPRALFGKVWYEGARRPEYVWQSSSGTDDFEPKLGLVPLIFGTLKATVFSLILAVPIALLAAIYTSEFLNARTRLLVKPAVELMASLPSVVLGFLAALVFAPIVAAYLPVVLAGLATVPLAFVLGAHLWQFLPTPLALRLAGWRFPLICLAVPVGVGLAFAAGPAVERLAFAGDTVRWLDGQIGGATGGWALLLLPPAGLVVAWVCARFVNPPLRSRSRHWSSRQWATVGAVRFVAGLVAALALAAAVGGLLAAIGLDPRGGLLGTYVQRNALVVGFVMGFAVIPIIYTIAEDALRAVPEHLRSASLGAGATPWQTAVRVVVPTAMSGLFSAVMIGLGRAVGETMIVLMAAGNTPVLEWNLFNGFRTLSANIAVELPEAVRNSTHYRTLFLAALVLFLVTFVLNTAAEQIRARFRKRAYQL